MAQPETGGVRTTEDEGEELGTPSDDEEIKIPSQDNNEIRKVDVRNEQLENTQREDWLLSRSGLVDALTAHYGSPGRLADYRRQFERTTRKVGEDPAIFATALETLAVKAFGDMGQTARLRLIWDRFVAGHDNCDLRRHLDSVPPETPIRDVVDRCRVWERYGTIRTLPFGSRIGVYVVNSAGQAEQLWLDKGEVACMSDFDDEDFTDMDVDSDDGSDMRVDGITGNSGNPQSDPDTDICTHAGNTEIVPQCLLEWPSRREGDIRVMNNVNDRKLKHSLTAAWCVNAEDSSYIAVCLWLIGQLRNLTFVFCRWKMLIHTGQEGPREGQTITQMTDIVRRRGCFPPAEFCGL